MDPGKILSRLKVKEGTKIADLGCGGAGHFIIPAAAMVGDETIVYAVDILKSVLKSVASKASIEGINNIKSIWSNLEIVGATNIKEASMDVALLINILFQSKNQENIIKEAKRLLKRNGKLLIIDWNDTPASFGPPPNNRVKADEIQKTAENLGLKLIEEFDAGNYHYGLIFKQ